MTRRSPSPGAPDAGLCATCVHARTVRSRKGSRFLLCRLSREDPRFPRYPNLPVERCGGHVESEPRAGAGDSKGEMMNDA